MLIQNWIPTHCRVKNTNANSSLNNQKKKGNANDRCRKHLNDCCCVGAPKEQRHFEPCHPLWAKPMNRDYKVHSSKDGTKAKNKRTNQRGNDATHRRCFINTVWGIERPASINPACTKRNQKENESKNPKVPTKQVQFGKGNVFCAEHNGQDEITKRRWYRGNNNKEDHNCTMHCECLVVLVLRHKSAFWSEQLEPKQHCKNATQ